MQLPAIDIRFNLQRVHPQDGGTPDQKASDRPLIEVGAQLKVAKINRAAAATQ